MRYQPCYFVVYRNADHDVKFVQLNAISARLLEILQSDSSLTGRDALEQIATEMQHPDPTQVVAGGEGILKQWLDNGILIGTINPAN